jgi:hypothetical protein
LCGGWKSLEVARDRAALARFSPLVEPINERLYCVRQKCKDYGKSWVIFGSLKLIWGWNRCRQIFCAEIFG